jgi:hypothetical protein
MIAINIRSDAFRATLPQILKITLLRTIPTKEDVYMGRDTEGLFGILAGSSWRVDMGRDTEGLFGILAGSSWRVYVLFMSVVYICCLYLLFVSGGYIRCWYLLFDMGRDTEGLFGILAGSSWRVYVLFMSVVDTEGLFGMSG